MATSMDAGAHSIEGATGQGREVPIEALPIGVLHLGIKTATLRAAGFRTIGDIREADSSALARIPLVGWITVNQLVHNRSALAAASRTGAETDWVTYCDAIGVPLLPTDTSINTGDEFLRALPMFFEAVAANLSDDVFALILRERICQAPGQQLKLEEIAAQTSPRLSRERIRQKEKKLLTQLTGGLLSDSYEGLDIHFHPRFSRWWRIASDALAGTDDIEVPAFIDILCEVWGVSHSAVMAQLPVILAIVTGEPQMSGGFRSATRINPRLFGPLSEEVRKLSVTRLRIGKCAAELERRGLFSLGPVVDQLRSDGLVSVGAKVSSQVTQHLDLLAGCFLPDGRVDWIAYREAAGLSLLPLSSPVSAAEFVNGLCPALESLLRLHHVTKRAPEIFSRRTSRDAADRMTLQRVADELQTHLPTIKKEESLLLEWLYDVIIDHDFRSLQVWLDETWLDYWSEAQTTFDAAEDYAGFAENLAWRWRLTGRDIRQAAPMLWAVLDGYPDDRRSGYKPPVTVLAQPALAGRIHLKGFRRLH